MGYRFCVVVGIFVGMVCTGQAQENKKGKSPPAGHSHYGEAFNEGPRQRAYLMGGTGKVHFPVTTKNPLVQKFIDQGVGQLHGFWYFEAERSFRQAAMLDPECAIAYWGMAKANKYNSKRAKGFIAEAVKRKAKASPREQMYIDALDQFLNMKGSRNKKAKAYVAALEKIAKQFPDDLEAKAFLGYLYWTYRSTLKMSYEKVDAHLKAILKVEPMHPVHHYIIHLWDYKDPKRALKSAALCGQSAPSIAHMWHMPGHTYSRLKRYADAVWQQEASARVDHKHMIRDRVLPDQIHNFAHNNEWLIRNLMHIGKWRAALDLAMNMTELPRHPKYNVLSKRRSASYGRQRLFEVLYRFELWQPMIVLSKSTHLEPTSVEAEQVKRLRHLGIAYAHLRDEKQTQAILAELDKRLSVTRSKEEAKRESEAKKNSAKEQSKSRPEKGTKTINGGKPKPKRPAKSPQVRALEQAISAVKAHRAFARGDYTAALKLMKQCGDDPVVIARTQALAGDCKGAIKSLESYVKSHRNETRPLAALIEIQWKAGNKTEAKKAFEQLRRISGHIQLGSPVFDRLSPVASALGYGQEWRVAAKPSPDVGVRPPLDSLGPFRWHPSPAPDWKLKDAYGRYHSLDDYRGKPVLLIFYLGYGCLHCAEQLEAFAPATKRFADAGISLIAISTDDLEGLKISLKKYKKGDFPFPLVSDAELGVFKAYRVYDDFENLPLHGTFLIDGEGLVRWQDISYEPFMDVDFVLRESQRLLGLTHPQVVEPEQRPLVSR